MALLLSVMMSAGSYAQDKATQIPDGPYLGQTPPGTTPEVFAPGIVNKEDSTDLEGMFG